TPVPAADRGVREPVLLHVGAGEWQAGAAGGLRWATGVRPVQPGREVGRGGDAPIPPRHGRGRRGGLRAAAPRRRGGVVVRTRREAGVDRGASFLPARPWHRHLALPAALALPRTG